MIEVADGEVKEGVHPKEKNIEHQETTSVFLYVRLWLRPKMRYGEKNRYSVHHDNLNGH